jgi:hypothetical protein
VVRSKKKKDVQLNVLYQINKIILFQQHSRFKAGFLLK